jgi:hypothetical protein
MTSISLKRPSALSPRVRLAGPVAAASMAARAARRAQRSPRGHLADMRIHFVNKTIERGSSHSAGLPPARESPPLRRRRSRQTAASNRSCARFRPRARKNPETTWLIFCLTCERDKFGDTA